MVVGIEGKRRPNDQYLDDLGMRGQNCEIETYYYIDNDGIMLTSFWADDTRRMV